MRRPRTLLTTLALTVVLTAPAASQTFGNVHGTVADETGTRLPGATVTLAGVGAPQLAISDSKGEYRFLNLDPGDYSLKATIDGYSTVEQARVVVALNRNTIIHFTLTTAIEDTVTVTSESPLLDERRISTGVGIGQLDLQTIPTARDPWAVMNQAPGVLVDRINVGGSESGHESVFIGQGSGFRDNDWLMDGIQITDATQGGSPTTYFDFEQFESIDLSTGGPDVTKNTPGVGVNLVTRRGTNEFRGTARFLSAKNDGLGFLGQSNSDFQCSDLAATQDCDSFEVSQVNNIAEYGFEAGGAAIQDLLWLWGSYGVSDINRQATGGGPFVTNLENVSIKVNAQIAPNNSAVASWNNGNKTVAGRDRGPTRAEETTRDQRGPSAYWRLEDTHIFGSSLYMNASYQKIDGGFQVKPRSGCLDASCSLEQETLWDSDGVWKQNWINGFARRPEDAFKLDGSYFFSTGEVDHELKFGGRYRTAQDLSNFNWPGRDIVHIAGENFGGDPGPQDYFFLSRKPKDAEVEVDYTSLWVQDTLAKGNWTVNVGLRYDLQGGTNQPGSTGVSVSPEIFPEITLDKPLDAGFDWESITPRIGVTYALGEDRDTLLRASFSQFPQALATTTVTHLNPMLPTAYGSYAYFLFFDDDNDNQFRGDESHVFLFGLGYDDRNPTTNWNTLDPGFDPEITTEAILGVEHSLLPEFVVGLSYTWRKVDDVAENRSYVRPVETSGRGFMATADDYVLDFLTSAALPDGTESSQPVFRLDPSLELSGGFSHLQNGSRSREYNGVSLTVNKRLANRWSLRGFLNLGETEWTVPADYLENSDPTDDTDTADNDGGLFMVNGAGGRLDVFLQSTWQWNLTGIYQVAPDNPWGFNLAANLYGREGYVVPYNNSVSAGGIVKSVSHVGGAVGRFRHDDITTVDLRADKPFGLSGNVNLTLGLELFNALNEATVLARATTLNRPTGDWVQDVISPRIWKLGVRVSWK